MLPHWKYSQLLLSKNLSKTEIQICGKEYTVEILQDAHGVFKQLQLLEWTQVGIVWSYKSEKPTIYGVCSNISKPWHFHHFSHPMLPSPKNGNNIENHRSKLIFCVRKNAYSTEKYRGNNSKLFFFVSQNR